MIILAAFCLLLGITSVVLYSRKNSASELVDSEVALHEEEEIMIPVEDH
jgi:hypothetical protein